MQVVASLRARVNDLRDRQGVECAGHAGQQHPAILGQDIFVD
jgi:hypothetical protein